MLASNLGQDTGYPDQDFSWFSQVPRGKCRDNTSSRPRPLPSKSFPSHPSSYHPTLYSLDTEKASLNNPTDSKTFKHRVTSATSAELSHDLLNFVLYAFLFRWLTDCCFPFLQLTQDGSCSFCEEWLKLLQYVVRKLKLFITVVLRKLYGAGSQITLPMASRVNAEAPELLFW
jgi:hypothetical protein